MRRLRHVALAAAVVTLATIRTSGGDPPLASPGPELDPQVVVQSACDRLKDQEAKHAVLKGVSKITPCLTLDDNQRLKSAGFVFAEHAVPPGKNPAKAQDESKPFVYVSVAVWSGKSEQPPGGTVGFQWKGQEYEAWVQVFGSDADLVKAVRKAFDETILAPIPKK